MINKAKVIFFLGGSDLEMQSIKKVLEEEGFEFLDKNLSWGANLSAYENELKEYEGKTIYGLELIADERTPKNYQTIDHHNELSHKPSSLFQVLELLDKKPTREQELISANDVGHIEAMKCMGASDEEIKNIRQRERIIQGITKQDEEEALKEIEAVVQENGIYIIETALDSFSPIVDNFEKRPLIVYSKKSFTYYGEIEFLKNRYKKQLENKEAYHGRGYFGFDAAYVGSISSNKLVKEIVEMKEEKTLHSYHTFMFPFIYDKEKIEKDLWCYKEFGANSVEEYNEKNYFYKHVQDALYNSKDRESKSFISKYFEYKDKEGTFTIATCPKGTYELESDGISLRIFNTGVAILAFNLKNYSYSKLEDVLAINDFGRRIYPQFLGENFTQETKNAFLADSITLSFEGKEPIIEDFKSYNKDNIKNGVKLPGFIEALIGNSFEKIQYVIDDRMFVISQYHNDELVEEMKEYDADKNQYEYEENSQWYQYLFVDGNGKNCQSKHMTKKLIHDSTYDRWVESGTLFGVSRYSFVVLTGSWYGENRLLPHTKTMYFQMFSLLLVYRATIIKFADEIQNVTQGIPDNISTGTSELYKRYLDFLNQLYFKEITAQDQGIELYEQAVKTMKIEAFLKDLDNEISELHDYVEMLEDKSEKEEMQKLTKMGAIFLPGTFIAGVLGMNIYPSNLIDNYVGFVGGFFIIGAVTWWITRVNKISIKEFFSKEKK